MNILEAIPAIKSVKDLQNVIASIVGLNEVTDEQIIWANALWYASSVFDCSTKDVANMLMDGIGPINNIQAVQNELDGMKEDGDDYFATEVCNYIGYIVGDVFGEHEKAEELRQLGEVE